MGNTAKARHRRQRRARIQSAAIHRLLSIMRREAKRRRLFEAAKARVFTVHEQLFAELAK
jgi:hypothetical protein